MNLKEKLTQYTKYANGDLSCECNLEIEDTKINAFDFSEYDLNNSHFGGVEFEKCTFKKVYLSGSNFGGSSLTECILEENELKKANWDDMTFKNSKINSLNAFRTAFLYNSFDNTDFENCCIDNCTFNNSSMNNVNFIKCKITDTSFISCKFANVKFINCIFTNPKFDEIFNISATDTTFTLG